MLPTQETFDAIVVGSGPGGATVAKELTEKGKNVLILEWGDNTPIKGTFLQTVPRAFIPGKGHAHNQAGFRYDPRHHHRRQFPFYTVEPPSSRRTKCSRRTAWTFPPKSRN